MIKENMDNKHALNKTLKRLVFVVLALLMCMTTTLPVFAEGTGSTGEINVKGLPGNFGKGEGFRLIGGNQYGYTISAFYKKDGTNVSTDIPEANTLITVLKTVTSNVPQDALIATQSTWQYQMDIDERIKYLSDFGGGVTPSFDETQGITVKGAVNTAEPLAGLITKPRSGVAFDTVYASKSKLGNPLDAGFAERIQTQYKLNSQDSEIAKIFTTIMSHYTDDTGAYYTDPYDQLSEMARIVYSGLDGEFASAVSAVIKSEVPDDEVAQGQLLINMVLPVSDKCVVGWGILIEPMVFQYVSDGAEKSSLLPAKFNKIMVSATDCAYINGASRAFADNIIYIAENAPEWMSQNAEAIIKAVSPEWMKKLSEQGEFAWNLKTISHTALPNAALLEEPWWGMPAKDPKEGWDDIDMSLGTGVGAYKNTRAVLKTVEPCCRPARMGTIPLDKCPCTGGKRCGCAGHTCSGPSECDCYTPPLKQGEVFINEEHLSEELSLLLIPTSSEKTFTKRGRP